MQSVESQQQLTEEFGDSIRAVRQYEATSIKSGLKVRTPEINPTEIMDNNNSTGDIADLGICKLVFDFLVQLHNRFPDRKRLAVVLQRYWSITQSNLSVPGRLLQQMYENCVAQKKDVFHKQTDENEAIVVAELSKVHYFNMCQIKTMWTPKLDRAARKAIWEHISRIIKVVSIVSKFSQSSRKTLNSLAKDTLSDQEKNDVRKGEFDIGSLLENIQGRVLDNEEMLESITNVANEHNEEMLAQGMKPEEIGKNTF